MSFRRGVAGCSRLAIALALLAAFPAARANPALPGGGQVVAGAATIALPAANQMLVSQASLRAVIDWTSFSIGAGASVHFDNGAGATLNRVLAFEPSLIAGGLSATGSLWLINPAGIIVTPSGRVNTGGSFVAATAILDPARFMGGGDLALDTAGGSLRLEGELVAGGDVVLVAHEIAQRGSVTAGGSATLVAAGRVVLRAADGDARIAIERAEGASGDLDLAGRISAAAADLRAVGGNVYALAANTSGVSRATEIRAEGGRIRLVAARDVRIGGTVDASGSTGGDIDITAGERVILHDAAVVAAGGTAGNGGRIRIGGARQGGLPGETRPLAPAQAVFVDAGAVVDASSQAGRGGEVILWSDVRTRFDGLIRADGPQGGGFVETSARDSLEIGLGRVEVGNGRWLLDPRDVNITTGGFTISPPFDPSYTINPPTGSTAYNVNALALVGALNAGSNVTVTTTSPGSTMAGDLTVSRAMDWTGSGSLTLVADRDILVNAALRTRGDGNLTLTAGRDIGGNGSLRADGAGNLLGQAGRNIGIGGAITRGGSGALSLLAAAALTHTGTITGTADGSGAILLSAGTSLSSNNNIQVNGSSSLTLEALTGSITFGGSGNRNYFTTSGLFTMRAPGAAGDVIFGRIPDVFGNMRWSGGTGGITVEAGRDVRLVAGDPNGRWIRLGTSTSTGAIRIAAGRNLELKAGTGTDNFTEIVGAGLVELRAGQQILVTSAGSQARIQNVTGTAPGSGLTLDAPQGTFAGPVQASGDTLLTGGVHSFTTAPTFVLAADRSFTLAAGAAVAATVPLTIQTSGTGEVSLLGPMTGVQLIVRTQERIRVDALLSMSGSDNPLVLVANDAGLLPGPVPADASAFLEFGPAAGLSTPAGRWVTYSVSPLLDQGEEILDYEAPNLYNRTALSAPLASIADPLANRRVYALQPVLTLTANDATKVYGTTPSPPLDVTATGLLPDTGDTVATATTGPIVVTSPGEPAMTPVGSYPIAVSATASDQGYLLQLVDGTLEITPALLSVSLAGLVSKVYDATTLATLAPGNLQLAGVIGSDAVSVAADSASYASADVGSGITVTASGLSLAGAQAGNYLLAATSTSAAVGEITPAPLLVRALDAERPFGLPNPPFTLVAQGLQGSDTLGSIGIFATSPAQVLSPPGLYPILVDGQPRNYSVTRFPGELTILPTFVELPPEQQVVPVAGGLVQQGVATGVNALNDTLVPGGGPAPAGDLSPVILTRRYTVSIEQGAAPRSGLGGASAFDPGTR